MNPMLKWLKTRIKKLKKPSTSKLVLLGAVLICVEIVLFCEYMMLTTGDLSSMYVLIGIPASLSPVILGYYNKSKAENTANGITYELAMREHMMIDDENIEG